MINHTRRAPKSSTQRSREFRARNPHYYRDYHRRRQAEIADRLATLREEAAPAPIEAVEAQALSDLLRLALPTRDAVPVLTEIADALPGITASIAHLAARTEALEAAGIDTATLPFEASYGRTTMEYYDGFVFGFLLPGRTSAPPVATGGRYDALTDIIGQGRGIPAVGGVIRPELVRQLRETAAP